MGLFGSSGVRGVVNREMTPLLALEIGMAVGSGSELAVVGMDSRTSGDMMEASVSAGLMACGCDVYHAGFVTTPTLAEAARELDCGVMLTASHNPPEYAGIKLWNPDGMGYGVSQTREVEERIASKDFRKAAWDSVGCTQLMTDAVAIHASRILDGVSGVELKVVVDCANGPASTITPYVLGEMGCTVITLNANRDGHFPGRMPEPVEANLTDLKSAVVSSGADLGIAHDGDADRMVGIDDRGAFLGGDQLLALFARRYSKRKAVVTVDTSMVVDEFVEGEVVRTRVGDAFVSEEVKNQGADFGGEPSGTWIFPDQTYCPDGILAAARLAEIASEGRLSELRKGIPRYPTLRDALTFELASRPQVITRLEEAMTSIECEELLTLDGYRLQFEDGWALARLSGTEPKVRVLAEAKEARRAQEIMDLVMDKVKGCTR
jgi:phosphoglucosamine mutase